MIICVEGPDRAGKTTILEPLAKALKATLITRLPTTRESVKAWPYIEPVYLHLLEQLIEPHRLYVSDRSMTVSAQVYSAVFNRPLLIDPTPWFDREIIVYVETPLAVLEARARVENGDVFPVDMYKETLKQYRRVLKNYTVITVDGTRPAAHNVHCVVNAMRAFK